VGTAGGTAVGDVTWTAGLIILGSGFAGGIYCSVFILLICFKLTISIHQIT
jgi:hypothetical protein